MTLIEVIFAGCTALAMVGGFAFEWRRQGAQDGRLGRAEDRLDALEARATCLEQWRDRVGRAT